MKPSFVARLSRVSEPIGVFFESLKVGKFHVSIQASSRHLCSPCENGHGPEGYTHFELRITTGPPDNSIISPSRFVQLNAYLEYWESPEDDSLEVWGFVPATHVQEILDILETL